MAGHSLRNEIRYRCRYPTEYALVNEIDHPRNVYVLQDPIVSALDAWLAELFDSEHLEETCVRLAEAAEPVDTDLWRSKPHVALSRTATSASAAIGLRSSRAPTRRWSPRGSRRCRANAERQSERSPPVEPEGSSRTTSER
jgi:hypothetical protein